MTILEIIQAFCRRTGVPSPLIIFGSQDDQILQLAGLANEILEDVFSRPNWTALQREATFVSTAGSDQGALTTLAPLGFQWVIPETLFDRTQQLPLWGPLSASEWQFVKASAASGPLYSYRIRNGNLHINPALPAGHNIAFEYASDFSVVDATSVAKKYFTADSDTFLLNATILLKGLRWLWKKEKGLAYAEDFASYEAFLNQLKSHDGTKPVLTMSGGPRPQSPGVFVPAGSWNVP